MTEGSLLLYPVLVGGVRGAYLKCTNNYYTKCWTINALRDITVKCHGDPEKAMLNPWMVNWENIWRITPSLWLEYNVLGISKTGDRQVGLK